MGECNYFALLPVAASDTGQPIMTKEVTRISAPAAAVFILRRKLDTGFGKGHLAVVTIASWNNWIRSNSRDFIRKSEVTAVLKVLLYVLLENCFISLWFNDTTVLLRRTDKAFREHGKWSKQFVQMGLFSELQNFGMWITVVPLYIKQSWCDKEIELELQCRRNIDDAAQILDKAKLSGGLLVSFKGNCSEVH